MFFEKMEEPQEGALVGQPLDAVVQAGKLAKQRYVVQGFFHGRVRQVEPLLEELARPLEFKSAAGKAHLFHVHRFAGSAFNRLTFADLPKGPR